MKTGIAYLALLATGVVGFLALSPREHGPRLATLTSRLDVHGMPAPELGHDERDAWPGPDPHEAPTLTGIAPIESNFDRAGHIKQRDSLPRRDADPVGAFRFVCQPGQLNWDDPIVYPGQPNASPHLHQWFGNTAANALSTYASLRREGDSTCMGPLNRSAYWMPAMIAGETQVVRPDLLFVYYKRFPESSTECALVARRCLGLPHGLRYIFGYDMGRLGKRQPETTRRLRWKCVAPNNRLRGDEAGDFSSFDCPAGHTLVVTLSAPDCWDGRNLDSADHRSHMAHMYYDGTRALPRCPSTHPYHVPQFTLGASWRIEPGDDLSNWWLASDRMPGQPAMPSGSTFHSDWFGAWDPQAMDAWTRHCIDEKYSCISGELGDGTGLRQASGFTAKVEPRLVPVPPRAQGDGHSHGHSSP
ncbi:DUF1996 domain-containing protein [Leptolyngbya sp. 15MV]|nr:DUF1996 domain-containing protein [Leptolyngbya sp. 15MV]